MHSYIRSRGPKELQSGKRGETVRGIAGPFPLGILQGWDAQRAAGRFRAQATQRKAHQ
jgi:hypothetical protein